MKTHCPCVLKLPLIYSDQFAKCAKVHVLTSHLFWAVNNFLSLSQMAKLLLIGFDHLLILGCGNWSQMVKLLLFGFDHWLKRLNANGKFAPLWFWSLAHHWLWWLTASGKMSLLGFPWMKQHSFGKSGVQESPISTSNEYVPVSSASNCVW